MPDPIFDLDNLDPLFKADRERAADWNGEFFARLADRVVMNADTGKIRFTSPWDDDDDR